MRILSLHNHYQQRGGEDESTAVELELLRSRGHEVVEFREHNDRIETMSRIGIAGATIWSREAYQRVRSLICDARPDIVHSQNLFPLISPSVYYAAKREGIPVVQTLHNYRLLCPSGVFFRDGKVCEDCMGKSVPLPGVIHACYRGSRPASGVVAGMLSVHRMLRTWTRMVDLYVALTDFARSKMIEGGLPADQIVVKPNFVDPAPEPRVGRGDYALFIGRLSEEKGIWTLLKAWQRVSGRIPLRVVGDGPLFAKAERFIAEQRSIGTVELLGRRCRGEVVRLLQGARFLVFPSVCYETFGRVAVEAFACGVPVVAAQIGAIAEVVNDGKTGLHFAPGDVEDLSAKLRWALDHEAEMAEMGKNARCVFEAKYTAERNYEMLIEIYRKAVTRAGTNV